MSDNSEITPGKKFDRSPAHPVLGIRACIALGRKIFEKEKKHACAELIAAKHMDFQGLNGRSQRVIAALKQFGILEPVSGKQVRISDDAYRLYYFGEDSQEGADILAKLAIAPDIIESMHSEFSDGLPSDASLHRDLHLNRGFTDDAASRLVPIIKEALEIAGRRGSVVRGVMASTDVPNEGLGPDKEISTPSAAQPRSVPLANSVPPPSPIPPTELPSGGPRMVWVLGDGATTATIALSAWPNREELEDLEGYLNVFMRRQKAKLRPSEASTREDEQ